jgi:hypothetical protein
MQGRKKAPEWAHSQSLLEAMLKSLYLDLDLNDMNDDWIKSTKEEKRK